MVNTRETILCLEETEYCGVANAPAADLGFRGNIDSGLTGGAKGELPETGWFVLADAKSPLSAGAELIPIAGAEIEATGKLTLG
jgi:hypothetical protein